MECERCHRPIPDDDEHDQAVAHTVIYDEGPTTHVECQACHDECLADLHAPIAGQELV